MEFLNPWGLLSLISVPALIALYILKQKHRIKPVPSLLLWKKTRTLMEASSPWERLKRNLLFILQLLLLLTVCFAIARPAVSGAAQYDEIVVIIDTSASMRAVDGGERDGRTRFERAVAIARETADGLRAGKKMSVIFAGDSVIPAVSHSETPAEIKKALSAAECGWSDGDVTNALLLADSMSADGSNNVIAVFTDREVKTEDPRIRVTDLSKSRANAAVTSISCGGSGGSVTVLSGVTSYGADATLTLELLCDGELYDAREVTLSAEQTEAVYWKLTRTGASVATVRIAGNAGGVLSCDDELSVPLEQKEERKRLIVSKESFFFEKIFYAIGGCEIYKTEPDGYDPAGGAYDLIIFDGYVPSELPSGPSVWFWAPPSDIPGIKVGTSVKGAYLSPVSSASSQEICSYVNAGEIAVARLYEFEPEAGWDTVLGCGMLPAVTVRTGDDGRRVAAVAFDIHDSNLPLLKEFPILIQNLLGWSVPRMTEGSGVYLTGSLVGIKGLAYSESISVTSPDGTVAKIAPPFPADKVRLSLPGVYTVTQTLSRAGTESEVKGYLVAGVPESESAMKGAVSFEGEGGAQVSDLIGQTELWPYFLIVILLLMAAEWGVYYLER
ncbi:MAG: BatA and WFA domain-containing protein [Clostridia bacterium]|nr:BatA and WFA domain-containing protein [Clostridia bacterium]